MGLLSLLYEFTHSFLEALVFEIELIPQFTYEGSLLVRVLVGCYQVSPGGFRVLAGGHGLVLGLS